MKNLSYPIISSENKFLNKSLLVLVIFFLPWSYLGSERLDVYSKELIIAIFFIILVCKNLIYKNTFLFDANAKYYFFFILICIFHFLIYLITSTEVSNFSLITHVLIQTILGFVLYLVFSNSKIKTYELTYFFTLLLICYLAVAIYFLTYAFTIHQISNQTGIPYFSLELKMQQAGLQTSYFGAMNGRSWFLLIFTSFFVGYFISQRRNFFAMIAILISLSASYYMLSRGGMLAGSLLLSYFLLKTATIRASFAILTLVTFVFIIIYLFDIVNFELPKLNLLTEKSGFSNRDRLVFESLQISINNFFLGNGFHSTVFDRDIFQAQGFEAISKNGPQNTWLSILVELGILGLFAYAFFWLNLYLSVRKTIKSMPDIIERHFLAGTKLMLPFVFLSFFFVHFFEKSFFGGPPIIMFLCGISGAIILRQKRAIRI